MLVALPTRWQWWRVKEIDVDAGIVEPDEGRVLERRRADGCGHNIQTLSYGKGAPRPVVSGVLRTAGGAVNLRPKAMRGPRKAAGLLKLLVRSPPSSAASHPDGG